MFKLILIMLAMIKLLGFNFDITTEESKLIYASDLQQSEGAFNIATSTYRERVQVIIDLLMNL
jgi:hypothetical protein